MSDLMREKVREVKAEGLSGNVKVLSRRALMDIVDKLIKAYGGLEHEELLSKLAEFELKSKQMETKIATLQGKCELYEQQLSETRKEDDDLRAKLKSDESRLPMLEEQNEVLKKTVSGLEAEIANIKREMADAEDSAQETLDKAIKELEELRVKVAEAEPRIQAAEAARDEAERRLSEKEDLIHDLEDRVQAVQADKEVALSDSREKIARLESALAGSDARKRILELENEVTELKGNLEALEIGIEFVDVEKAPQFGEAEAALREIEESLIPKAYDERVKPLQECIRYVKTELADGKERFPKLQSLMYDNQGTIHVACQLAKLLVRHADLHEELKALKAAAELLS
ncbi:MAG: hypothetical protein ACYTHM_10015 [Planctomycetota bacterium]